MATLSLGPARVWGEEATIRGAGASTCSVYAQVYGAFRLAGEVADGGASVDFLQYEEWIDGYILGMETSFKGEASRRDWNQVDIGKWISVYCQEHQSDITGNAALALFKLMHGVPF